MPWWETELPSIRHQQSAYLKRHLPALPAEHEDLVNDTLLALTKHIRRYSSALPTSWFQDNSQPNEAERLHLHRLAMVILRRRIADLFRKRASLPSLSAMDDYRHELADTNAPSTERKILLAKMLQVTWSVLDEMKPKDRDLVALISEDAHFRKSLSPRERQRLHRIRRRLKDEIVRQLGVEAADLLRITP